MATNFSFNLLLTTLQTYIDRGGATSDPTVNAYLPVAINLTETRIARMLKLQGFLRNVLWTMQSNLAAYQKPDRWRANVSMAVGTGPGNNTWSPVYTRDFEWCRQYWPNANTVTTPKYYADMDYTHWWFAPTPDVAYPVQTVYYELPSLLDNSNQQNWTCEYAPNALLHGCLEEIDRFLKKADEADAWKALFTEDMAALNGEDAQKVLDRMERRNAA